MRLHLFWAFSALLGLSACSGLERNQFPPTCPQAAALPTAGELALYKPGGGRDLMDVQIEGQILSAEGKCEDGDRKGTVDATLIMQMRFRRGPAAPTRRANIPYFVAVARGEHIFTKQMFVQQVTFPPNVDSVVVKTKPARMTFPVGPDRSAATYQVWVGFQKGAP